MKEPGRDQLRALLEVVRSTCPEEIDCEQFLACVAAFLEASPGEKLPPELEAVRQHLSVCPPCMEEFEVLRRACGTTDDDSDGGEVSR